MKNIILTVTLLLASNTWAYNKADPSFDCKVVEINTETETQFVWNRAYADKMFPGYSAKVNGIRLTLAVNDVDGKKFVALSLNSAKSGVEITTMFIDPSLTRGIVGSVTIDGLNLDIKCKKL